MYNCAHIYINTLSLPGCQKELSDSLGLPNQIVGGQWPTGAASPAGA